MDTLDSQLIALLQANARMTVKELSRRLSVSRGTITNRLKRLEDTGVIAAYTLRLGVADQKEGIHAWTTVMINGDQTNAVMRSLIEEPCVTALHDTNGRWDLLIALEARSLMELSTVLDRIRKLHGIQTTETSIHLTTLKG